MTEYANPLELARVELGDQFYSDNCSPVTGTDQEFIERLHIAARLHGFISTKYWAETAQGLVMPVDTPEINESFHGKIRSLEDIRFAGSLKGYHKFSLGKLASWCFQFEDVTLGIPRFARMLDSEELWVPTISLQTIVEL